LKSTLILGAVVAIVLAVGFSLYVFTLPAGAPSGQTSQSQSQTNQASPTNLQYDCSKPAVSSQYSCNQIPTGYQIAPRYSVGIEAYCPAQMTQSACALLKQTYNNGVCDPNETTFTSPLDCGCTGSLVGDPYTGRCALPASVCQLAAAQGQQPQG
jgi:hypothetical protein